MKKVLFLIIIFAIHNFAQSSTKYFIYFKDKGIDKTAQLSKSSFEYNQAINSLSERSLKRRIKKLGENSITFEDLPIKSEYVEGINESGAKIVWKLKWFNAVSAYLSRDELKKISNLTFIDKIEKVKTINYKRDTILETKLSKTVGVSDAKYNLNYGPSLSQVELSDVPIIHDAGFSGQGVLVGILDAGFAWQTHPALQDRDILAERDFVNGDDITDDGDASHGTAVFSIIGGFDEGQIIGPAYSAQYVLAKTEDVYSETSVEEDNYAAAMEWMDSIGVDITTTSLGYSEFDNEEDNYTYADMDGKTTIVTRASEIAFSKGILTIVAAGNEGNTSWKYITAPADGFNTIAVGAVSSDGSLAPFSSVGPTFDRRIKPELVARGVGCYLARAYLNDYTYDSGTSVSAPIVSGIASQLLSAFPYLSNEQARDILILAGDRFNNPNNQYGYGLLSSMRALEYPNVKLANTTPNNEYPSINKLFLDSLGVFEDSVFILYTVNSEEIIFREKMVNDGNNIYSFNYEGNLSNKVNFEFEYLDSTMVMRHFPTDGKFIFINGSNNILYEPDDNPELTPTDLKLSQNYPNPFNELTSFELLVPEKTIAKIKIYNILGQKVKTINYVPGVSEYYWDGSNDFGGKVSTGVYIYSATSETDIISKKMIYLK